MRGPVPITLTRALCRVMVGGSLATAILLTVGYLIPLFLHKITILFPRSLTAHQHQHRQGRKGRGTHPDDLVKLCSPKMTLKCLHTSPQKKTTFNISETHHP